MRYKVAALAQAVQEAIDADRVAWENATRERQAEVEADIVDWLNANRDRWAEAALAIRRKLRNGEPVRRADLPSNHYGQTELFSPRRAATVAETFRPSDDLLLLQRALEVVADDTVTAAGLRELGVTAATMRRCTMHLARSTASA